MNKNGIKAEKLAIYGGEPLRKKNFPYRRLFTEDELHKVTEVFKRSWEIGRDFGYQGEFEEEYCNAFCNFHGGGFADAVSSGTTAIYLSIAALELPKGSDIIVSPVTDPGGVTPVVLQGFNPVVADSARNSFNIGPEEFEVAITDNCRCAIITHVGGIPVDMGSIMEIAEANDIMIIEDCSQAHGAMYSGQRVGTFGKIAAFSTMFSKLHATGGSGGLVYTQNENIYWRVRAYADRGKFFNMKNFDPKNPNLSLFPALNFNSDEISCAIGIATLSKLQSTIDRRCEITRMINEGLSTASAVFPMSILSECLPSPFFHTVCVDINRIKTSKKLFAMAIASEGISINPDYQYVVSEWPWLEQYLKYPTQTPNVIDFRNATFNILFNERFNNDDTNDIVDSILKVESFFLKT